MRKKDRKSQIEGSLVERVLDGCDIVYFSGNRFIGDEEVEAIIEGFSGSFGKDNPFLVINHPLHTPQKEHIAYIPVYDEKTKKMVIYGPLGDRESIEKRKGLKLTLSEYFDFLQNEAASREEELYGIIFAHADLRNLAATVKLYMKPGKLPRTVGYVEE